MCGGAAQQQQLQQTQSKRLLPADLRLQLTLKGFHARIVILLLVMAGMVIEAGLHRNLCCDVAAVMLPLGSTYLICTGMLVVAAVQLVMHLLFALHRQHGLDPKG
jgi:hypothetical protein